MKIGAVICIYDDIEYLSSCISGIVKNVEKIYFLISTKPWFGKPSNNSTVIYYIKDLCKSFDNCEYYIQEWDTEPQQRNYGMYLGQIDEMDYVLQVDSDEIYSTNDFSAIRKFIYDNQQYDSFYVHFYTYWKKWYFRIDPPENLVPILAARPTKFFFQKARNGVCPMSSVAIIPREVGVCHHMSYARSDVSIKRKIETFSHADEILKSWYNDVWLRWTPEMENLYPVKPSNYKRAIKVDPKELPLHLRTVMSYRSDELLSE